MAEFSASALLDQVPTQFVSTGGGLALLVVLVVVGLLALTFWRQVLVLVVAAVFAVVAYGLVDVLGTMRR